MPLANESRCYVHNLLMGDEWIDRFRSQLAWSLTRFSILFHDFVQKFDFDHQDIVGNLKMYHKEWVSLVILLINTENSASAAQCRATSNWQC